MLVQVHKVALICKCTFAIFSNELRTLSCLYLYQLWIMFHHANFNSEHDISIMQSSLWAKMTLPKIHSLFVEQTSLVSFKDDSMHNLASCVVPQSFSMSQDWSSASIVIIYWNHVQHTLTTAWYLLRRYISITKNYLLDSTLLLQWNPILTRPVNIKLFMLDTHIIRWHENIYSIHLSTLMIVMMVSSNGDIFPVTDLLCKEFPSTQWTPLPKATEAKLCCFLRCVPEQNVE